MNENGQLNLPARRASSASLRTFGYDFTCIRVIYHALLEVDVKSGFPPQLKRQSSIVSSVTWSFTTGRDRPRTLTPVRHRSHPSRTAPHTVSLSPSLSHSFSLARIIDRHHSHHRLRHCLTLAIDLAISTSLSPTLFPSLAIALAIALIIRHRSRHRSHQYALSPSPSLALLLIITIPSCTTSNHEGMMMMSNNSARDGESDSAH